MSEVLIIALMELPHGTEPNFKLGLKSAKSQKVTDLHGLPGDDDLEGPELLLQLCNDIKTLEKAWMEKDAELAVLGSQDNKTDFLLSGGMSMGDVPTNLFEPMSRILANPGVCKAIGFRIGYEHHACTAPGCGAVAEHCDFCGEDARHMIESPSVDRTIMLCDIHVEPFNVAIENDNDMQLFYSEVGAYSPCDHMDTW